MDYKNILALWLISCAFHVEAKSSEAKNETNQATANITEELIRNELERFASIQEALKGENLNITVIFSKLSKDENDYDVQQDLVQLRPLSNKYNPNGPQMPEEIDEKKLQEMFEFANKNNMTAIVSRETYSKDGSLSNKAVYLENVKISYDDGKSSIVITHDQETVNDEKFDKYINMLKQYELPLTVEKTLYDEDGDAVNIDVDEYIPKRVRIVDGDMQTGRKLDVSEALKRAFIMKEDENARLRLLCQYLKIQYPKFTWKAIIGDGGHYLYSDERVTLALEGQTYTVIANEK